MAKKIPLDALIMLHNRLDALAARSGERKIIIKSAADFYDVSVATIYRALRNHKKPQTTRRLDYNHPRVSSQDKMRRYCELIAALKLRTTNKKGRHLSTPSCIRLLETSGVETPDGLIKVPKGFLKKSTVSRYLKRWGFDQRTLSIEPPVVRFQAAQSNDCWHFDFSPSDFKRFKDDPLPSKGPSQKLMLASVVDDRSGVTYEEYHYVPGEDVMTALKFLFNAMAPKKHLGHVLQGIPQLIYMDNGPVAKSTVFKRVMAHLGIEVKTHLPAGQDGRRTTARSKGKVERPFRTVKESLETLYHLHPPQNLKEANEWLRHYLKVYNEGSHRYESHSRLEDWKTHLPSEGFRAMCDWNRFSSFAREPEDRVVGSDACVSVSGVRYQLSGELAGQKVILLWGLFDNELFVEAEGKKQGPFYPSNGPIPLGTYRKFKKTQLEKKADDIGELAKQLSIPRTTLDGGNSHVNQLLDESDLREETPPSIPFAPLELGEETVYRSRLEAKTAIAHYLGIPLARLSDEQMIKINEILSETLEKKSVIAQIKQLFKLTVVVSQGR